MANESDRVVKKMIFKTDSLKEASRLLNETISKFKSEMKAEGMNKIEFFPTGIDLIELSVTVDGVSFKVAGPQK